MAGKKAWSSPRDLRSESRSEKANNLDYCKWLIKLLGSLQLISDEYLMYPINVLCLYLRQRIILQRTSGILEFVFYVRDKTFYACFVQHKILFYYLLNLSDYLPAPGILFSLKSWYTEGTSIFPLVVLVSSSQSACKCHDSLTSNRLFVDWAHPAFLHILRMAFHPLSFISHSPITT